MADNLPLIPDKGSICADVRPVLREVFRELDCLPPLTMNDLKPYHTNYPGAENWVEKYTSKCEELRRHEAELQEEHARRISREALPNIYKTTSPAITADAAAWKLERGIIRRTDLVPSIEENAGRDTSLWVKNIMNRSSCDLGSMTVQGTKVLPSPHLDPVAEYTDCSFSMGHVVVQPPPPPPLVPPPPPQHEYILCVPPQLDFVNFKVGQLHTRSLRLVNVSKFEIRVSVRPPARRELAVHICGVRGLTVTSGAAAELRVQFRPRDVLALHDCLHVRVSVGKPLVVPIACYMQPPILDVLVPNISTSSLSCTPGEEVAESVTRCGEVVELGSRLLGDVHKVQLLLNCEARHAAFFVMTEDAWISSCLDNLTSDGSLQAGAFTIHPVCWAGGGIVRGTVWCRAPNAGLHVAPLRMLASTAVVRPLHLLADSLYFKRDHITLQAQDKDYDICSEDDPACEYYVHLGTGFPHRSLSATVQIVNHSSVLYSYYWSVRPWGVCSCWEEEKAAAGSRVSDDASEQPCIGAKDEKARQQQRFNCSSNAKLWRVEPAQGRVAPRSSCPVHVCMPDVGDQIGVQRAVLMLVLKDIPRESIPLGYDALIVNSKTIQSDPTPGVEGWSREVCDVVCCQLEVWWDVVAVRFILDPPYLLLPHSRRVKKIDLKIRATQLYGCESVYTKWELPPRVQPPASQSRLSPANSLDAVLNFDLPSLPNEYPETDVIGIVAENDEWRSQCRVVRQSSTRQPRLEPARAWLGLVPPGARLHVPLEVLNDTHQHIRWWSESCGWWDESALNTACRGREPCEGCQDAACTCTSIQPAHGELLNEGSARLHCGLTAPSRDGCVVRLVVARSGRGVARASLVSCRVLAPRLVLRAIRSVGCNLDPGAGDRSDGTAVLRPNSALIIGTRTRYRLIITNITPIATTVSWDPAIDSDGDILKVEFIPNHFKVGGYEKVDIQVELDALRLCSRRLFVVRAKVEHAYTPLYLVIDAAVAGLVVSCEVPLGDAVDTDATFVMRRMQRETLPYESRQVTDIVEETFVANDLHREVQKVCEPPSLTRVCPCSDSSRFLLPECGEQFCLQFTRVPLNTVRSRILVLRNESILTAQWSAAVRRWPRIRTRHLGTDRWAAMMRDPGLALEVKPASGVLAGQSQVELTVRVYSDCWGLYRDQIMIQIESLEPIILDVWVEILGAPLSFPAKRPDGDSPVLWMSASDPTRTVRARNASRSRLDVHAYVICEHEQHQDRLPFRIYIRFLDVVPATCPCSKALSDSLSGESDIGTKSTSFSEEMDTGIELYLAEDYGVQDDQYYKVEPEVCTVDPNAFNSWTVTLMSPGHGELAPNSMILLRCLPLDTFGDSWYRPDPAPQLVYLKQTVREGQLRLSCREVIAKLCALDLPFGDVLRIRKRFRIQNVGNGPLNVTAETEAPWRIVQEDRREHGLPCGTGCGCYQRATRKRLDLLPLHLEPRSSLEMCVEVCCDAAEIWPTTAGAPPCQSPSYPPRRRTVTPLVFRDGDNLLATQLLVLDVEFPILKVEPVSIDFGFVTDGDTRKTYFTVAHICRDQKLDLTIQWVGSKGFEVWPLQCTVSPSDSQRIYVQYTAKWSGGLAEGCVSVSAIGSSWCSAAVPARAAPTRDFKCHRPHHDFTDDDHLLPPGCVHYR